jgi:hypothetical protein
MSGVESVNICVHLRHAVHNYRVALRSTSWLQSTRLSACAD